MTGTHHPLLVLQTLAGLPEPSDLRWNRPDAMLEWRGRTAANRFAWSTWTSSRHAPPVGALSAAGECDGSACAVTGIRQIMMKTIRLMLHLQCSS